MASDSDDSRDAGTPDSPAHGGGTLRRVFTVDISGRRYKIESEHEPETVRALARYVDRRMRQIAGRAGHGDVLGAAVLAALNIADDYFQTRRALERREKEITERTRSLAETLGRAVEPVDRGHSSGTVDE